MWVQRHNKLMSKHTLSTDRYNYNVPSTILSEHLHISSFNPYNTTMIQTSFSINRSVRKHGEIK